MSHALIENGVVAILDLTGNPPEGYVEVPAHVCPGFIYDGQDFFSPEIAPPPVVFPLLTPRQLWLTARQIGITKDQVLAIIDAMPETTPNEIEDKEVARIEIMEAPSFRRDHPLVELLAGLVGLSSGELDDLWLWAAGL